MVYRFYCIWENKKRDKTGTMEGFEHAYDDDLTDRQVCLFPGCSFVYYMTNNKVECTIQVHLLIANFWRTVNAWEASRYMYHKIVRRCYLPVVVETAIYHLKPLWSLWLARLKHRMFHVH